MQYQRGVGSKDSLPYYTQSTENAESRFFFGSHGADKTVQDGAGQEHWRTGRDDVDVGA